jgi:DNA-binding response OmpR family regulator
MKILVVKDERRAANFICRALRKNSYTVDVADSGERALGGYCLRRNR